MTDVRTQAEQTVKMLNEAHARLEAAKDGQIKELQAACQAERSEKERLLKLLDKLGTKS